MQPQVFRRVNKNVTMSFNTSPFFHKHKHTKLLQMVNWLSALIHKTHNKWVKVHQITANQPPPLTYLPSEIEV